jgi:hypothetical protein
MFRKRLQIFNFFFFSLYLFFALTSPCPGEDKVMFPNLSTISTVCQRLSSILGAGNNVSCLPRPSVVTDRTSPSGRA